MASSSRLTPQALASIVLVVTIAVVSVALVVGTDLHPAARVAISAGAGVIAAAITFVVGARRGTRR
ncbi:hypothetical protein [Rathayibacter sp. VKM Ac-2760]|uniref:hypothetical protein n=1 Tax=Rathayibacter sp. VKM Ac-2760 TaxID=2609253 RepID=UPI0013184F37|nr:hypothetical protein [Rathayibacter sp. VKM Ac-2760]QHC57155.1 hypothetical protein GSU72_00120 [Rathayibacter sp. VKM Ac-2760]